MDSPANATRWNSYGCDLFYPIVTREQPIDRDSATPIRPARHGSDAPIAIIAAIVATLIGLVVFAWAVLFITKGRFLKPTFQRIASRYTGRAVKVAGDFQLYFDPLDIKFLADGLTVSNPAWATKPNLFEAQHIDTRIKTFPLIFGTKKFDWIGLVNGHSDLEWDKVHQHNTWTFGAPGKKGEPFQMPQIRRAQVSGTELVYRDPKMQLSADVKFEPINAQDTRFANSIRFSGSGTARGHAFTLYGAQTSPNQLLEGGRNQFQLHAHAVDSSVDVSGTLPGATQIEGADLSVAVRGGNLRNLADLAGIAVPDTRAYTLRSHVTKQGGAWKFTHLVGNYGDSDIAGGMTVTMPKDRLNLQADLASHKVDIVDIGPFIGYNPNALATKGATAAVAQTGGTPRILPDAPLRIDALSGFDAHVHYAVTTIRAPHVPVSNVDLTLDLDHKLLKLSPMTMDISGGHLASDISIDARDPAVVTAYDIRLSPTPMGKLLAGFGVDESGTTGTIKARIQMKGIGDSLRKSLATSNGRIAIVLPAGTFWTRNIQLAEFDIGTFVTKMFQKKLKEPVQINCGLIAFTVKDGVAAADPVLIDTNKNVMIANGGFSFRDEALNINFRARAKTFSLFSGQSPVGIQGYFAAPKLALISPQLVTRAGAAVALGVVGTPIASVLAFVDLGGTKGAACGPVLAGATAAAQETVKGKPIKGLDTRSENSGKAADSKHNNQKKKVLGIF